MEVAQMISVHGILVDIFLVFLVLGALIPFMVKKPAAFKKASFIYTMVFQAIATMIAFAGIVAVFAGDLGWPVTTILMFAVWAVMMFIEIKKHKFVKLANLENETTFKVIKSAFFKISLVQILLVVIMYVIMVLKAQGVLTF